MIPFQWILTIILCLVIGRILWQIGARPEDRLRLSLWGAFWLVPLALILLPEMSILVAHLLGIGRGVDVAVYFGVLLLFYLVYLIGVRVYRLEVSHARVVRRLALQDLQIGPEAGPPSSSGLL